MTAELSDTLAQLVITTEKRKGPKIGILPPTMLTTALKTALNGFFVKATKGYHLINEDPIKESRWEAINSIVLKAAGCSVSAMSSGSHKPGSDITCSLGGFSNKSAKYIYSKGIGTGTEAKTSISSYRLTTACSDKSPGSVETIVAEIQSRKNFDYYSVLIYHEETDNILYDWYLIPADHPVMNPTTYTWTQKMGKQGSKKDTAIGWITNNYEGSYMDITFSMSSQLWIHVSLTPDLRTHLVASSVVPKGQKYDYITLFEKEQV